MVNESIYTFLTSLRENNNRDWFNKNRHLYDNAKKDFEFFVEILIKRVQQIDPSIDNLRAKDCIFRIFRDVRFSKDKSPYKTNFGAFISRGGRKSPFAGYYLHLEPGQSFMGGGLYMPPSPTLKAIRNEIFHNSTDFKTLLKDPCFTKHFSGIYGEKLKTAPRGIPKDFPDLELLKHKHYAVVKPITDTEVHNSHFMKEIEETFSALHPLNKYLNSIIEDL